MEKPYLEMYKLQSLSCIEERLLGIIRCFVISDVYGIISSSISMILKYFIEHTIFNDISMYVIRRFFY